MTPAELVARYLDRDVQVGLDAESWGRHLAGWALDEAYQALIHAPKSDTKLIADWRHRMPHPPLPPQSAAIPRAQELIAAKIRVPSMDLRYREALRAAQRILEEVE